MKNVLKEEQHESNMNKKYFIELAQYNIWANNLVISWLEQISDEQWKHNVISSFNSIAETVTHIAGAEKVWADRWQLVENIVFLKPEFSDAKSELIEIWQTASANILHFIEQMNENDFAKTFSFKRLNGEENTLQYAHTFTHVINHSTYHRGQLVTMLRQVDFTGVSSTDAMNFYRSIEMQKQ